jgi:ribosomal protein S18 acetylase RimI-like enzyme
MTTVTQDHIVREINAQDRQKLANLIHFEAHVHRHLDWRTPLEWVGWQPYLVVEQRKSFLAALACPPDPPSVAWLRLFAASHQLSVERAWDLLWPQAMDQLGGLSGLGWAAAIPMFPWFERILEKSGFEQANRVVMMSWEAEQMAPIDRPAKALVRPMNFDDLAQVEAIDIAAFDALWRNSQMSLEIAFHQASVATVVEQEGQLVAYQISTATSLGGHLARLAVLPEYQGQGAGYSLVYDLLSQFMRRGARSITVNTQSNNQASLALYQKMGFHFTGEEYPVYQLPMGNK